MKRAILILSLVVLLVAVSAVPGMAQRGKFDPGQPIPPGEGGSKAGNPSTVGVFCILPSGELVEVETFFECILRGGGATPASEITQEAESGDVNQIFEVSSSGDNSNQCVGTQGVANTGNAQNAVNLIQVSGNADDFEFDELDSSIEVSPSSDTTCDQEVNQAASASG